MKFSILYREAPPTTPPLVTPKPACTTGLHVILYAHNVSPVAFAAVVLEVTSGRRLVRATFDQVAQREKELVAAGAALEQARDEARREVRTMKRSHVIGFDLRDGDRLVRSYHLADGVGCGHAYQFVATPEMPLTIDMNVSRAEGWLPDSLMPDNGGVVP